MAKNKIYKTNKNIFGFNNIDINTFECNDETEYDLPTGSILLRLKDLPECFDDEVVELKK